MKENNTENKNNLNKLIDSLETIDPDFIESAADISLGVPPKKDKRRYWQYLGLAAAAALLVIAVLSFAILHISRPDNPVLTSLQTTDEKMQLNSKQPASVMTERSPVTDVEPVTTTAPSIDGLLIGSVKNYSVFSIKTYSDDGAELSAAAVVLDEPEITIYPAFISGYSNSNKSLYREYGYYDDDHYKDNYSFDIDDAAVTESIEYWLDFFFSSETTINGYVFHYNNSYKINNQRIVEAKNGRFYQVNSCTAYGLADTENGQSFSAASVIVELDVTQSAKAAVKEEGK